jgi:hypothetical protein
MQFPEQDATGARSIAGRAGSGSAAVFNAGALNGVRWGICWELICEQYSERRMCREVTLSVGQLSRIDTLGGAHIGDATRAS